MIHRLNFVCHLFGWFDNPFARRLEAVLWESLEADMAEFRAGRLL